MTGASIRSATTGTRRRTGLTISEVERRRSEFGPKEVQQRARISIWASIPAPRTCDITCIGSGWRVSPATSRTTRHRVIGCCGCNYRGEHPHHWLGSGASHPTTQPRAAEETTQHRVRLPPWPSFSRLIADCSTCRVMMSPLTCRL